MDTIRIVAVHVLVETLHDVRKRLDVGDVGLLPEPFGERIDRAQIFGIGNTAFAPSVQRIFQPVQARQVLGDVIRITPELVPFIEVLGQVVAQLDARHAGCQHHHRRRDGPALLHEDHLRVGRRGSPFS